MWLQLLKLRQALHTLRRRFSDRESLFHDDSLSPSSLSPAYVPLLSRLSSEDVSHSAELLAPVIPSLPKIFLLQSHLTSSNYGSGIKTPREAVEGKPRELKLMMFCCLMLEEQFCSCSMCLDSLKTRVLC